MSSGRSDSCFFCVCVQEVQDVLLSDGSPALVLHALPALFSGSSPRTTRRRPQNVSPTSVFFRVCGTEPAWRFWRGGGPEERLRCLGVPTAAGSWTRPKQLCPEARNQEVRCLPALAARGRCPGGLWV